MANDKRLFDFCGAAKSIATMRNVAAANPVVIRLTNPASANLSIVICALEEPANQILPLNVLWLDLNPNSGNFMRILRRVEKNTGTSGYVHKWAIIPSFDDINVPQEYDIIDKNRIQVSVSVGPATQGVMGVAKLSYPPASAADPIAVGTNDPRLSDARNPLAHTHPLPPVTSIKTFTGSVAVDQTVDPENGMVLMATSATTASWKFLAHGNIIEG